MPTNVPTVTELLKEDHRIILELFHVFNETVESSEKKEIVLRTIRALRIHAILEEEMVYPLARKTLKNEGRMNDAEEEHYVARILMDELERLEPFDAHYDAKFRVLSEAVKHHIDEEELYVLPILENRKINVLLMEKLLQRKNELESYELAHEVSGVNS